MAGLMESFEKTNSASIEFTFRPNAISQVIRLGVRLCKHLWERWLEKARLKVSSYHFLVF